MEQQPWYQQLFDNYARTYENENFVQGTIGECDFIEQELGYDKSIRILDVGCGTGRHSIELGKRGYRLTGIDLSSSQLKLAEEKAAAAGLTIDFRQIDARAMPFQAEFDAAIMLCEGGFPLMETDEMNYEILKQVSLALKPSSTFIFTTLNGSFPLYHSVEAFCNANSMEGNASYHGNSFDLMTFRDYNITEVTDDSGILKTIECNERYYVPSEITWLLKSLGFSVIEIFGARLGAYSRNDKLSTEDFEMLVIARK